MPRKKAEPEVLQEETVQPEITDIEELTPAERPGLAPQIEEPVQPYGEEESSVAEELPEPGEPEKKSFYDLDFRALDQDLSPEQRQEWNTIYASFRSRSVMRGTIIGVDPHSMTVRSAQTGQTETKRMYCAVIVPFRARILIPETEMWAENDERPAFVLRNMPGAQIDFVITHVDREAGFAIGSRRLALTSRRYFFSTQPLHQPGSRVPCHVLAVGPRRCLVECYGYDVNLSQRDMSYAAIPDLREQYHPGDELTCESSSSTAEPVPWRSPSRKLFRIPSTKPACVTPSAAAAGQPSRANTPAVCSATSPTAQSSCAGTRSITKTPISKPAIPLWS